jgi:hypothetical protein
MNTGLHPQLMGTELGNAAIMAAAIREMPEQVRNDMMTYFGVTNISDMLKQIIPGLAIGGR